jgi:Acyl-CoA reductase (LuxC)
MSAHPSLTSQQIVEVPHVIQGETVFGAAHVFGPAGAQFATPRLDLDRLVWPRAEPGPAFDLPLAEIMDVLVATGERMTRDPDGILAQACEQMKRTSPLDGGVLERAYAELGSHVNRGSMEAMVKNELGGRDVVDGWRDLVTGYGQRARVRAFPPRLVHILAGNAPGVAVLSIVRGALVKGVHLLKLPSNDQRRLLARR